MSEVKLLPCPFCGTAPQCWGDSSWTYIRCGNDQCIVYSAEPLPYNGDTHCSDAITAWNRRATAAKDAEIEALRAEVELLRMGVCGDACLHIAIERDQLKSRAERLAEALRVAVESDLGALWIWPESAREQWMKDALAALAQESNNAG